MDSEAPRPPGGASRKGIKPNSWRSSTPPTGRGLRSAPGQATGQALTTRSYRRARLKGPRKARPTGASGHLRRMCDSLAKAALLIPCSDKGVAGKEAALAGRAYSLDALAFAIAVDTKLFLDAMGGGAPLFGGTRAWLGRTLATIGRLLSLLEASPEWAAEGPTGEARLRGSLENLRDTAIQLRTRLAVLCSLKDCGRITFSSTG